MKNLDENFLIILSAFHSVRYGISPSVPLGTAENHAKKQGLAGEEYTAAIEAAIGAGLVGLTSDSSLSIKAAGRTRLGKR
jgi:hypothetical protein